MPDSAEVLSGFIWVYTLYALAILSVMLWFALNLKKEKGAKILKPGVFYTWVGTLVVLGVSLHVFTFNTIPWAPLDFNRDTIQPDQVVELSVRDHQFVLPSEKIKIKPYSKVLFRVTSADLTYGFGLFRQDHSMVFQMQVVPGRSNDLLWQFSGPGLYTIKSTEYSGPRGILMDVPDAVEVAD